MIPEDLFLAGKMLSARHVGIGNRPTASWILRKLGAAEKMRYFDRGFGPRAGRRAMVKAAAAAGRMQVEREHRPDTSGLVVVGLHCNLTRLEVSG